MNNSSKQGIPVYVPVDEITNGRLQTVQYIDSSTHRLRETGSRTFKLKFDRDTIHLDVNLTRAHKTSKKTKTIYTTTGRNKAKITIPVRPERVTMLSSPLEIGTVGANKLFLSVRVKPSGSMFRTQEVAVSLYSSHGSAEDKSE